MTEQLINDMAKDLCHLARTCNKCPNKSTCKARVYARRAVAKGYRNGVELASKIFEEIHQEIHLALESNYKARREHFLGRGVPAGVDGKIAALRGIDEYLEHIEQKYKVE